MVWLPASVGELDGFHQAARPLIDGETRKTLLRNVRKPCCRSAVASSSESLPSERWTDQLRGLVFPAWAYGSVGQIVVGQHLLFELAVAASCWLIWAVSWDRWGLVLKWNGETAPEIHGIQEEIARLVFPDVLTWRVQIAAHHEVCPQSSSSASVF